MKVRSMTAPSLRQAAFGGAVVAGQGADEAVASELLGDMSGPAREPGGNKDRRERRGIEADEVVGGAGGVVEVGVQPLGLVHGCSEGFVYVEQVLPAAVPGDH